MKLRYWLIVCVLVISSVFYGIFVGVYKVFPFPQLQAAKQFVISTKKQGTTVVNVEDASEHEKFAYDFANDPIAEAFYGKVPPLLKTVLKRYEKFSEYHSDMFPLSPADHAIFKQKITNALVRSMDGPGGKGERWLVHDASARQSPVRKLFEYKELKQIVLEGRTLELGIITIHESDDQVPVVKCIPEKTPAPGIIFFSGHTHEGLRELFVDRASYQKAAALELCKDGYVTIATEKIDSGIVSELFQTKGERWRYEYWADDEDAAATMLFAMNDYSIMGRQLMTNIAALELLAGDERVSDPSHIGAGGVSLGGWLTLHTALVNPRIQAIANYGGVYTYVERYLGDTPEDLKTFNGIYDNSQLTSGLWRLGDQNRFIYAVAPAVMMTGYGAKETAEYLDNLPYFYPGIEKQYEALGAKDKLEVFVHPNGHEFPVEPAKEFFHRRLPLDNH